MKSFLVYLNSCINFSFSYLSGASRSSAEQTTWNGRVRTELYQMVSMRRYALFGTCLYVNLFYLAWPLPDFGAHLSFMYICSFWLLVFLQMNTLHVRTLPLLAFITSAFLLFLKSWNLTGLSNLYMRCVSTPGHCCFSMCDDGLSRLLRFLFFATLFDFLESYYCLLASTPLKNVDSCMNKIARVSDYSTKWWKTHDWSS